MFRNSVGVMGRQKTFVGAVAFLLGASFFSHSYGAKNLLSNPSFEDGFEGGWVLSQAVVGDDVTLDTDGDAVDGEKALVVTIRPGGAEFAKMTMSQDIPVTPGHVYSVSGDRKQHKPGAGAGNAYIQILYVGESGVIEQDYIRWATEETYTHEAINSIAPAGAKKLRVMCSIVSKSISPIVAHYDNMCVTEGEWYIASENVLTNGGFESGLSGWDVASGSSATSGTANPRTGSHALMLSSPKAHVSQRVTLEEGATYNLYGYSRVKSHTSNSMSWFEISYFDANGSEINSWNTPYAETWTNTEAYAITSRELQLPPQGAVQIEIALWNEQTTSYFDDVKLVMLKKNATSIEGDRAFSHIPAESGINAYSQKMRTSSVVFLPNGRRATGRSLFNASRTLANGMYLYRNQMNNNENAGKVLHMSGTSR